MNKFKKATKRIAAVGVAAAYAATTALAAGSLGNYPTNFVEDNKFFGQVVIGNSMDSSAANAVIASLKEGFDNSEEKYLITARTTSDNGESSLLEDKKNHLYVGENFEEVLNEFTYKDFSKFLETRYVEDKNGEEEEYEYRQKIMFNENSMVKAAFNREAGNLDDETNKPVDYIRLDDGSDKSLYQLDIDFRDTIKNVDSDSKDDDKGLVDSETIKMFGSDFTFSPKIKGNDDLVLYTSSKTVVLNSESDSKVTVDFKDKTYEVEMIGASSQTGKVQLRVNGKTGTVEEGDSATIGGLKLFVKDVFVNDLNNDMKTASAEIFLGSDELIIPTDSRVDTYTANGGNTELEINGDTVYGYTVETLVDDSSKDTWNGLRGFRFTLMPNEFENEKDYLLKGESIQDPVFKKLTVTFDGLTEDLTKGAKTTLTGGSKDATIRFVNIEDDSYNLKAFTGASDSANVNYSENLLINHAENKNISDREIFILNSDDNKDEDKVTGIYEVTSFSKSDESVKIRNLLTGKSSTYELGDKIEDTGVKLSALNLTTKKFQLDTATGDTLFGKNGVAYTISLTSNVGKIVTTELAIDDRESIDADTAIFETLVKSEDAKSQIKFDVTAASTGVADGGNDESGNNEYFLSKTGTYIVVDSEDSKKVEFTVPETEKAYNVDFRFGALGEEETFTVPASQLKAKIEELKEEGFEIVKEELLQTPLTVEFDVTSPVFANEIQTVENTIVVGGPAANAAARTLLGIENWTPEGETVRAGNAVIELFDKENAVLVYGWSKEDTIAGVTKLNEGSLSGKKVEVKE